jgi:hypothetical protein
VFNNGNLLKLIGIDQYYHILNESETRILFNTIQEVFEQIFQFEIENKSVRHRFCTVSVDPTRNNKSSSKEAGSRNYDQ